jgi:formylglycine-generating enzyme required for sulfatase activity
MLRPVIIVGLCIVGYVLVSLLSNIKISPWPSAPTAFPTVDASKAPSPGMVLIPAGPFQMGSNQGKADEKPVHTVTMSSFLIDVYEVTNANYARCVSAGRCPAPVSKSSNTRPDYYGNGAYANYPMVNVSWNEATTYCQWRGARLPTEAEWEKAGRGGLSNNGYPWGDTKPICVSDINNGAQFSDCGAEDTLAVGNFRQNGYGLFDMAGNVYEWVNDWYGQNQYGVLQNFNPSGPPSGENKVVRGGSWNTIVTNLRVTDRAQFNPASRKVDLGFRCAASVP